MSVRRIVTGHDRNGNAVSSSDQEVDPLTLALIPGFELHLLWGADQAPTFPDDGSPTAQPSHVPPVGGYRFMLTTVPAGIVSVPPDVDLRAGRPAGSQCCQLPGVVAKRLWLPTQAVQVLDYHLQFFGHAVEVPPVAIGEVRIAQHADHAKHGILDLAASLPQ